MKSVFLIGVFLSTGFFAMAQNKMTLKEAIETGIKNNIDVLQSDLLAQKAGITLNQSRENRLPNLNANANEGINYGRSIDPFTNAYIDQKVGYGNYGTIKSNQTRPDLKHQRWSCNRQKIILRSILSWHIYRF
jgi:outer membrane protein